MKPLLFLSLFWFGNFDLYGDNYNGRYHFLKFLCRDSLDFFVQSVICAWLLLTFIFFTIPIIYRISVYFYLFGFYLFQFYINSVLIKDIYQILIMSRMFQAGSSASTCKKGNCGRKFKTGKKKYKYKVWSNSDFLCLNDNYQCTNAKCGQGMKKKKKYRMNDLWFANGSKLGEGGFSEVYEYDFHGNAAAYKKIQISIENNQKQRVYGPYSMALDFLDSHISPRRILADKNF